ncbi:hypothetical protein L798_13861 [Zootermopsis nevadensis]|uniref:Uncharacterized protein n=1 Tax=Zootermopsis nevadensis TaxID=136037 RepID=A0A067R079_ZOONE|nr:hypothetical protein L798_13861 [Zootermopsis nevadensis]
MNYKLIVVMLFLVMGALVEGKRLANLGHKLKQEAEKVGKEAGHILEGKVAQKAADVVFNAVLRKG